MKVQWIGVLVWSIVLIALGFGAFFVVNSMHQEPKEPTPPIALAPPPAPPKATAEPIPIPTPRAARKTVGTIGRTIVATKPASKTPRKLPPPLDIRSVAQLCSQYAAYHDNPIWKAHCARR
jgi:hypothetical protein